MSAWRLALSALIVYHLAALSIDAIPPPSSLIRVGSIRPPQTTVVARYVTPILDRVALFAARANRYLFAIVSAPRRLTNPYIEAGLTQKWNMFSEPDTDDRYLRLAYVVSPGPSEKPIVVRALVFPAHREDAVRLLHDYRDKAVMLVLREFAQDRTKHPDQTPTWSTFTPLVRYFRHRYEEEYLTRGRTVTRTEVWYGSAPMPPPGDRLDEQDVSTRLDVLRNYYDGPVPAIFTNGVSGSVGSQEREADIVWTLEHIEPQ